FLLTTFFPMICSVKKNEFDPSQMIQSNEFRQKVYFLDNFEEEINYLLPRFKELGYLD
ncbi:hypothetical protein KR093_004432, partial [Drosophila rubida]